MNLVAEPPTDELRALGAPAPPAERGVRFVELAAAVRRHERAAGSAAVPKRPADHDLYRLLSALERLNPEQEPR
ncbi:MAG TPA: hypothetical protein VD765_04605 [Solirubrobacterales bacterium]|nr:hypothetical protein [Solirubrobacterales bacterium]